MSYRLAKNTVNYIQYRNELIDLLQESETIIVFDTNILSQIYKLRLPARNEFYTWITANVSRIKLPHWSYSEYMKRAVDSNRLKEFYPIKFSTISKEYNEQRQHLNLLIDDTKARSIGFSSCNDLINKLDETGSFLNNLESEFRTNDEIEDIKEEINRFLLDIILPMSVSITNDLEKEFQIRVENQIPPGFSETKEKNKIGDFIIWKEILEFARTNNCKKMVFLTNDKKPDLQYQPQKIEYNGRIIPNNKTTLTIPLPLKLADPRLVNEFYQVTASDKFYICGFELLAHCLQEMVPDQFKQIGGYREQEEVAIDSPEQNTQEQESTAAASTPLEDEENPSELVTVREASYLGLQKYSIIDSILHTSPIAEWNNVIEKLKSHSWGTQSSGIHISKRLPLDQLSKDERFLLGRNIYQTACGGEWDTIRLINSRTNFVQHFGESELVGDIVQGMLFEVYFNSQGKLRTQFKNDFLEALFKYRFDYVDQFLQVGLLLRSLTNQLIYAPGDPEVVINFFLSGQMMDDKFEVNSILVNGKEILVDDDSQTDHFSEYYVFQYFDLFRSITDTSEATKIFASKFLIPAELVLITTSIPPTGYIRLARNKLIKLT